MNREVTAFAPASVSNVASGFDIMGFALDGPGDSVTVRLTDSPRVRIRKITGTTTALPMDVERNTAGPPVLAVLELYKKGREISPAERGTDFNPEKQGIEIDIHKGLPIGSGIGSSATSAVAAAVAANELLGAGLSLDKILECAIEGEKIASGAVHVDNLAPSLFGGFILVRGYNPIDIVRIKPPKSLWCTIIYPHIEIRTIEARRILPKEVPLCDVITQTGNAAGLVAGLMSEDYGLIGRSLKDVIAEPARAHLIPRFKEMKDAAIAAGALGCSISGAGPSLFALSSSKECATKAGESMSGVLQRAGLKHSVMVSGICQAGTRIISGPTNGEPIKAPQGALLIPFMS